MPLFQPNTSSGLFSSAPLILLKDALTVTWNPFERRVRWVWVGGSALGWGFGGCVLGTVNPPPHPPTPSRGLTWGVVRVQLRHLICDWLQCSCPFQKLMGTRQPRRWCKGLPDWLWWWWRTFFLSSEPLKFLVPLLLWKVVSFTELLRCWTQGVVCEGRVLITGSATLGVLAFRW